MLSSPPAGSRRRCTPRRGFTRPMVHLPHFIDRVDDDWSRPGRRPHERPYFLFVGRLEAIKGLQTVIPLWADFRAADLLIAGAGTDEGQLRALAGTNTRVKFVGAQSQQALGPLYHHALACVIPSLTYETFGMITLEAFGRTPVIARDLGPLPEVVNESGGGLLFCNDAELRQALCVSQATAIFAMNSVAAAMKPSSPSGPVKLTCKDTLS